MTAITSGVAALLSDELGEIIPVGTVKRNLQLSRKGFGDLALPCFVEAQIQNIPASELASRVAEAVIPGGLIESVESVGGFVNLSLNRQLATDMTLRNALEDTSFGSSDVGQSKFVVVEFSAPNTGKPMHVGHIRSTVIGDSMSRCLMFTGHRVHRLNYTGDIGLHMGKVMAAVERWSSPETLKQQPMEEMLDLYVRFNAEADSDPSLAFEAQTVLREFEEGNEDVLKTWKLIRDVSMDTFEPVYDTLDVQFDEVTGQSLFIDAGKRVVAEALEKGVARRLTEGATASGSAIVDDLEDEAEVAEGAVIAVLEGHGLPDKVILRSDGTATYSTQDLGAAVSRHKTLGFDSMIYVVGDEQRLYFQQIFKILELLGYEWVSDCVHIPFGHLKLEGSKMSSRLGNILSLDEVLETAIRRAAEITESKDSGDFTEEEISSIARDVGISALKYSILSTEHIKEVDFSWKSALDFEANSAPYIQYTHARASRLLARASIEESPAPPRVPAQISDHEFTLIRRIDEFPDVVLDCAVSFRIHRLAHYLSALSNAFGDFYNSERIFGSPEQEYRLALTAVVKNVIGTGLGLLGIAAPEKM